MRLKEKVYDLVYNMLQHRGYASVGNVQHALELNGLVVSDVIDLCKQLGFNYDAIHDDITL